MKLIKSCNFVYNESFISYNPMAMHLRAWIRMNFMNRCANPVTASRDTLYANVQPSQYFLFREPAYTILGFSMNSLLVLSLSAVTDDINDQRESNRRAPTLLKNVAPTAANAPRGVVKLHATGIRFANASGVLREYGVRAKPCCRLCPGPYSGNITQVFAKQVASV